MNLTQKIRNYFGSFFVSKSCPQNVVAERKFIDIYLEKTLEILCWRSIESTATVFFIINTVYWVILLLNIRFYGALSLITLIFFIGHHCWSESLFAEHKSEFSIAVQDIKNMYTTFINMFCNLRNNSPTVFYSIVTLLFLIINMMSRTYSGSFFVFLFIWGAFSVAGALKLIPENVSAKIKEVLNSANTPKCVLAEHELIPFIQDKDFNKQDMDLESLLTDKTADSVTNSLVSGITSMPSYLEEADIPNDIQEEDLLPQNTRGISLTPGEFSSSESDSENKEIKFDSDHFNTSSSEDDLHSPISKIPTILQQIQRQDEVVPTSSVFRSMINSVGGNIMSNMFSSAVYSGYSQMSRTAAAQGSESDNEFEIVDATDIDDECDDLKDNK